METGYQRGRIQDESLLYEHRKHDGSLPIIGVNTFLRPDSEREPVEIELARATEDGEGVPTDSGACVPDSALRRGRGCAGTPQAGGRRGGATCSRC
ncbi:MAG: hypothetical protein V9G04_00975 [Nocardioides sp.]